MKLFSPAVWLVLTAASAVACGSSSSDNAGPTTPNDAGPTDSAPPDAGATLSSMSVLVIAPAPDFSTLPPAPNAKIAVDLPGGEHRELTVGADGRATIEGIDWSLGVASVVAYGIAGRSVYGVMDVTPANMGKLPKPAGVGSAADVVLYPQAFADPRLVTVSGTVASPSNATNSTLLSGTRCGQPSEVGGASYSIRCVPGKPFTLIARDERVTVAGSTVTVAPNRWFKRDVPIPTGAVLEADIDFATATQLVPHTGAVHVKTSAALKKAIAAPNGIVFVSSKETSFTMLLGAFSSRAASATGLDFNVEWVDVAGQTPFTVAVVFGMDGTVTQRITGGVPTADQTFDTFVVPPLQAAASLEVKAPLVVDGDGGSSVVRIDVRSPAYVLQLDAPPGTKTLHPPILPAEAKPAPGALSGSLLFLDDVEPESFTYSTFARSKIAPAVVP